MSTYTVFLLFPTIIGFGIQFLVFSSGNYSHWSVAVYAAYLSGWALTFSENMTHVEDIMAMRWGTYHFLDVDREREEYVGVEIINPGR